MNKRLLSALVFAGLVAGTAAPAMADHDRPGFRPHDVSYDSYRHVDRRRELERRRWARAYRHWLKKQRKHRRKHRRQYVEHEIWHWFNDGRWDPFYRYDHRDFHQDQYHDHEDFHYRNHRRR